MDNKLEILKTKDYAENFWRAIKGDDVATNNIVDGKAPYTGAYNLPHDCKDIVTNKIIKNSDFRKICTVINNFKDNATIFATKNTEYAGFVEEGGEIPIYDGLDNTERFSILLNKLAICIKLDVDLISDLNYDIKTNLTDKLGTSFGKSEDNAYINGIGTNEPIGILHNTKGATLSHETNNLTYDDITKLYFNVDKKYRTNGVFMMNDETAYKIRSLKDADGNYIWEHSNDTILSKPVIINEFMPNDKPIVFGDFKYYWIVIRRPITIKLIKELFMQYNQFGYIAYEFLDGKLINQDAIKYIKLTGEE